MEIFAYKKGTGKLREDVTINELPELIGDDETVIWVDLNVSNQNELAAAESLYLDVFNFHHLTLEDCREERNQPKVEAFEGYLFFIVHGVKPKTQSAKFITKELDGFLGHNYVVTNRDEEFASIDSVKEYIRAHPRALDRGAAYLLHQILDRIVDHYMPIVDDFDTAINELEDRVYLEHTTDNEILEEIMDLRRSVARLKRISTRQLDVLYRISHGEFPQIPEGILPFYRDVHDHLLRIADMAENYRDLVSGLFEIHFSVTANKTTDVMKFLALISATMLPLTLLSGIYGMNFSNMPLLHSNFGYHIILGLMVVIFAALIGYFWRKGWFRR